MINSDFKILLAMGGFAVDLITALYNPSTLKRFNNKKVVLNDGLGKLKSHQYRQDHSFDEKIEYLKSIEQFGVCCSHDMELSVRLRKNTYLIHCSDNDLAKYFYARTPRPTHDMIMSFEDNIKWQISSRKIFNNQVDLANLRRPDFLDKLNIRNEQSEKILKHWLTLNVQVK
jgi:hypothetical protein